MQRLRNMWIQPLEITINWEEILMVFLKLSFYTSSVTFLNGSVM